MIISILSGKGGVGKTSITAFLSKKLKELGVEHILIDADVGNPNLNTFFNYKLENYKKVYETKPKIIEEKCLKCGICAEKCPKNTIIYTKGKIPKIFLENCSGCMLCKEICPFNAIIEENIEIGEILRYGDEKFEFYVGIKKEIEAEETKIIQELLNINSKKLIIIDAPAGSGCSILRIAKYSDRIIYVVEDSYFGYLDFLKVFNSTKKYKTKKYLILNKYKNSKYAKKIEEIAKKEKIDLICKIKLNKDLARKIFDGRIDLTCNDILKVIE